MCGFNMNMNMLYCVQMGVDLRQDFFVICNFWIVIVYLGSECVFAVCSWSYSSQV